VSGIPVAELKSFYNQLEAKAHARLKATLREHAPPGVDARAVVLLGEPARDVVRWADRNRVDLIVIGSHSVESRDEPRVGWGTTSYKVALLCRCPVLLVKSAPRRRRIGRA
jgi:nucleotide-binding universal stress UspA family protein